MHLDEHGEAEPAGLGVQPLEGGLVEPGDDEQDQVGAGGAGLPQLVAGDDEVLAQHRDGDLLAHGAEVVERAAEAALLGQHADDGRATGLVVGRERGGVRDVGQVALARRLALDLADHADAGRGERRHRVERRRGVGHQALQLGQRRGLLAGGEVDTYPLDDLVEDGHDGPFAQTWCGARTVLPAGGKPQVLASHDPQLSRFHRVPGDFGTPHTLQPAGSAGWWREVRRPGGRRAAALDPLSTPARRTTTRGRRAYADSGGQPAPGRHVAGDPEGHDGQQPQAPRPPRRRVVGSGRRRPRQAWTRLRAHSAATSGSEPTSSRLLLAAARRSPWVRSLTARSPPQPGQ